MRGSSFVIALAILAVPAVASAQVHVRGYFRSDGTYVAPSVRTAPNNSRLDNYSTQPNVNPYTGRTGTVDPYAPPRYQPYRAPAAPTLYKPYVNPYAPKPAKRPCYGFGC